MERGPVLLVGSFLIVHCTAEEEKSFTFFQRPAIKTQLQLTAIPKRHCWNVSYSSHCALPLILSSYVIIIAFLALFFILDAVFIILFLMNNCRKG